jgi:hypothetical protein
MYRINRSVHHTKEEKVAVSIGKLLSDFHLDLEKVGYYLHKATPYLVYRRALEVLESAQFQENTTEQNKLEYRNDRVY